MSACQTAVLFLCRNLRSHELRFLSLTRARERVRLCSSASRRTRPHGVGWKENGVTQTEENHKPERVKEKAAGSENGRASFTGRCQPPALFAPRPAAGINVSAAFFIVQAPCGCKAAGALTAAGNPPVIVPLKRQQKVVVRSKLAAKCKMQ